jgi:hypothetical protein
MKLKNLKPTILALSLIMSLSSPNILASSVKRTEIKDLAPQSPIENPYKEGLEKCDKALTACDKALEDSEKKSAAQSDLINQKDLQITDLKQSSEAWYRSPIFLITSGIILGILAPKVIGGN